MTASRNRRSIACVTMLFSFGCEPQATLGERVRTTPALADAASCSDLEQRLKANLAEEFEVRLLMSARSSMVGGYDDNGYMFSIDDELPYAEDAFAIDPPRFLDGPGLSTRLQRANDLGAEVYVGIVANSLSAFSVIDGVPSVFASVGIDGNAIAFARSGNGFVVLSSVEPFSLADNHPLRPFVRSASTAQPGVRPDKPSFSVPFARVTRLTLTGTTFTVTETLFVEGDALGITQSGDRAVVATRFYASSPELRVYPTVDTTTTFDFFSVGRAMADSRAHNAAVVDELTLDDVTPRIVRGIGSNVERLSFPCTRTLAAQDMPGRTIVTFTTIDLNDATPGASPPAIDAIRTSHATLTAGVGSLFVVENAAPLWWYWETEGIPLQSNVHHFVLERAGLAPTASTRIHGIIGAGRSTVVTDAGALAVTTRDSIFRLTIDGRPGISMLHRIEPSGAFRSVGGGLPPDMPPQGLHRLFEDLVVETPAIGSDATLFDAETLVGGAPLRIPGHIESILGLDDQSAYAVETSLDENGFPNGFTRVFEVANAAPLAPLVRLILGTSLPPRITEGVTEVEVPVVVSGPTTHLRALYYVDENVMLIPRADAFGGTSLAVVALRRDEGLSLVATVSDTYVGDATASLIDRALVDEEHLVTIGAGGIVVRAFPDLVETGRYVGGQNL
jgi:hypothetical protein